MLAEGWTYIPVRLVQRRWGGAVATRRYAPALLARQQIAWCTGKMLVAAVAAVRRRVLGSCDCLSMQHSCCVNLLNTCHEAPLPCLPRFFGLRVKVLV
jgi:hypothetical protein